MKLFSALGRRGLIVRIARPFTFLVLIVGLIAGTELSAAVATEFLSAQEAELSRLLNDERTARGLPPLAHSDALRTVARRHAQRMMMEGTIFHNERLAEDVEAVFPDWARIGENVGVSPTIPDVHRAFMDSPGHRANILDPDWGWLGVGAVSGGSRLFVTENFLKLRAGAPRPLPAQYRLAGSSRIDTARAVGDFGWIPGGAGGAVLAPAGDFHGALAGASLAASVDGPLVLSGTDTLAPEAQDALERALQRNSGKTVYLVGGPFADAVGSAIASMGLDVVELGGADHVATAAAVARTLPSPPSAAFIATVANYPDALAASAVSAVTGWPILYTDQDQLSTGTQAVLQELGIGTTYIVGGEVAVSDRVASQLGSAGAPVAQRVAGPSRFSTATAVADFGLARGLTADHILVATGTNFPDALAGGALASVLRSPVVLSLPNELGVDASNWLRNRRTQIDAVYLLGGQAALSAQVEAGIANALS